MDFKGEEYGKLQNMNDDPKKDSSEYFKAEAAEGRGLVQEPSAAAEYLQKKLTGLGYEVTPKKGLRITLTNANSGAAEGYCITKDNL